MNSESAVRQDGLTAETGELSAILAVLPVALVLLDGRGGALRYANEAFWGLWRIEALPKTSAELCTALQEHAASPELFAECWEKRSGSTVPAPDTSLRLRDGRELRWRTAVVGPSENMTPLIGHFFDELAPATTPDNSTADDLFRLTFEQAAVGMALLSVEFGFVRANASLCGLLGYEEPALRGMHLLDLVPADDSEGRRNWERYTRHGGTAFHLDQRLIRQNGEPIWAHLSVSVVRDSAGRPVCFMAQVEDVTQRKRDEAAQERREQALLEMATTDSVTGLYNRRFMMEFLNHRLIEAKRTEEPVSVLMLDIDWFHDLNERFGHDAGDQALRSVAACLQTSLREHDIACRYGGDELVVVLAGAPQTASLAAAERLRERLLELRPVAKLKDPVTCSIGVATFPEHASTAASLIKAADVALYRAKHSGRNAVAGYEPTKRDETAREDLDALRAGLQGASTEAVKALITAIDLRDRYTGAHCQRATKLAIQLAEHLGCSVDEIEVLRLGVPLLDVGKIGLPDGLLTKPGHLSPEEWNLTRQHPVWGEQLIRRAALPRAAIELVRWHHERLDGSGYPDSLQGDQIPFLVRIVNVADAATALREDRPHRRAWPRDRVLEYLRKQAPQKLDAQVVQAYCELFRGR